MVYKEDMDETTGGGGGSNGNLYPEDVLGAGEDSDVVRHDIEEETDKTVTGSPEGQRIVEGVQESQALAREASFSLLDDLQAMGVEDAAVLREKLEAVNQDPDTPLDRDMSAVTRSLEAELASGPVGAEGSRVKRLSSLSDAVFGVATVRALLQAGGLAKASVLIPSAQDMIEAAKTYNDRSVTDALTTLLNSDINPAGPGGQA